MQNRVQAVVRAIQRSGLDVFLVEFSVPSRYNKFIPGQFLHLALDPFDPSEGYWPDSRVFSICSEPSADHVSIVYSVKGHFTKRMSQELVVGSKVWLKYPYGDFIVDRLADDQSKTILVAGGTGISPYIPFLLNEARQPSARRIELFYGVRDPDHFLFQQELALVQTKLSAFRLHLSLQEGSLSGVSYKSGALCVDDLRSEPDLKNAVYFLSGPPQMIQVFKFGLSQLLVDPSRIKIDEWN